MKNKSDFKFDNNMRKVLDSYQVNSSLSQQKEETFSMLKEYLPTKKKVPAIRTAFHLLHMALNELIGMGKLHFGIFILLICGLFPIVDIMINPHLMIFFTAPVPLLIGYWNVFGRGHEIMIDLEKTYKYSYHQIICSKITIVTGISILFLTIPITYFLFTSISIEILSVFRLVIWGLTPILTFATILLLVTTLNRNDGVLTISLLIWGIFAFAATSTPIGDLLLQIPLLVYILLNMVLVIFFIYKMVQLLDGRRRMAISL